MGSRGVAKGGMGWDGMGSGGNLGEISENLFGVEWSAISIGTFMRLYRGIMMICWVGVGKDNIIFQ